MSANRTNKDVPTKDPYEVLGISFGATDTEISKAYRNLARTLHPDKLVSQNLSQTEIDNVAIRFQDIQIARSFLLDVENTEARRKYDAKMASEQVRRATDKAREMGMSERRKRMRDELKQYEEQEASSRTKSQHQSTSLSQQQQQKDTKSKLAREGIKLRERYAVKEELGKQQERAKAALALQNRQIRLKWSRKKLKAEKIPSPSEDSIAKMLSTSCDGTVEQVQMLGDKGNAALVTFTHVATCDVAVQLYRTSELWRAVYVNKTKQDEEDRSGVGKFDPTSSISKQRDHEDVHEWKERQAREREALLRQMAEDDDPTQSIPIPSKQASSSVPSNLFPLPFPEDSDNTGMFNPPLDILEQLEDELLMGIVSDVMLQQMKVIR